MKLTPRFDKIPAETRAEPAFVACQYVLPVGVIATTFASLCVSLFYQAADRSYNWIMPLFLSALFFALWQLALPKVRKPIHLDWLVLSILVPVVGHFLVLAYIRGDTETSSGIVAMTLISAILFRSTWVYFIFAFASLSGWLVANRLANGIPIESRILMNIYLMAPIMIFILRHAWTKCLKALINAKKRQNEVTRELSKTVRTLEEEKRLRQQSENQLLHAQKMESLGLLAGGVAHDFNNFLMGISALAETLEQDSMEPATLRSASEIKEISKTAATVCRQMLTYSGRAFEPHRALRVDRLIREMLPLLRASIPKNINLQISHEEHDELVILADSSQIQQSVLNLITNSGQSISNRLVQLGKGSIEIRLDRVSGDELLTRPSWPLFGNRIEPREYISISVIDNGEGIPPGELSKIFDPYFTRKESGHGLGLSVTLGIAASHGGAIRCKSRQGYGTTIEVLIPASELAEPLHSDEDDPQMELKGGSILIVDDEAVILRSLKLLMSSLGWEVVTAESGENSLKVLETQKNFDLILLDYSMPGMNGLETLAVIRSRGIHTPVLLCSGFMMPEELDRGAKPDAFIQKPYQLADLKKKIEQLMSGPIEMAN